jgi:galactokinase
LARNKQSSGNAYNPESMIQLSDHGLFVFLQNCACASPLWLIGRRASNSGIELRFHPTKMTLTMEHVPAKISDMELSPSLEKLVDGAKHLYKEKLAYFVTQTHKPPAFIVAAPGRVNLIGEHTDYTEGFVLPLAVDQSTVIFGTGFLHTGKGMAPTTVLVRFASDQGGSDLVEERTLTHKTELPDESDPRSWANYVVGVVAQFLPDLPAEGCTLDLAFAICSDVPLGAGLSSSASLEVAVAKFVECFMHQDLAYSSVQNKDVDVIKERALRCQIAENEWAFSPCGIMDQLASSAAQDGSLMLIDCRSLEVTHVPMKEASEGQPVILVTNSKVEHEIADSEYGVRRRECQDATEAMQQVPLYHVLSLRDATLADVKTAKDKMEETTYRRATHVVTENMRVKECKIALKTGLWDRVGELMNHSHSSLKDDFEVSCEEIDFLVEVAQKHPGVYGSRMTGGGFGGCTVTLVKKENADELIGALKADYMAKFGKLCDCFLTQPGPGARVLGIDKSFKAEN